MSCAVCGSDDTRVEESDANVAFRGKVIKYTTKQVKCNDCIASYAGKAELDFNAAQSRAAFIEQGFDPDEVILTDGGAVQ